MTNILRTCSILKKVFPVLRGDEITRTFLSDDLIIKFGNRLCQKYRSPNLYNMIRARLTIKKDNPDPDVLIHGNIIA